uniref:Secreted protein n=1 Tax=Arundo donax TaxID=35708 RepID=A0A0A9GGD0_ARUDO
MFSNPLYIIASLMFSTCIVTNRQCERIVWNPTLSDSALKATDRLKGTHPMCSSKFSWLQTAFPISLLCGKLAMN